jgi:hypothetical protein
LIISYTGRGFKVVNSIKLTVFSLEGEGHTGGGEVMDSRSRIAVRDRFRGNDGNNVLYRVMPGFRLLLVDN